MRSYVTFSKNGASVTLPAPARFGHSYLSLGQAAGRTAGGQLFVYDLGATARRAELEFRSLTTAQRDSLAEFFEEVVHGMREPWQYTDPWGRVATVRFAEPELSFTQFAANVWDITLRLELESFVD